MSRSTPTNEPQPGRIDRILAFTAVTLVAISIISMFAVLIARWLDPATDFTNVGWQIAANLPVFGLPIAFIMIILLLVINFARKARSGRKA